MVQGLEARPLVGSEYKNESWEIEGGVIAHILVAAALSRSHVKIDDLGVDVLSVLEGCDERTDILKCSSTDQL